MKMEHILIGHQIGKDYEVILKEAQIRFYLEFDKRRKAKLAKYEEEKTEKKKEFIFDRDRENAAR